MAEYITKEIPYEEEELVVEFEVEASYGNRGIGSYEFWGMKGSDDDYCWEIDFIGWDAEKFTAEQNKAIEDYTIENEEKILNEYIKIVEERGFDTSEY